MKLITLDKVSSSNDFLKDYAKKTTLEDFTTVVAHHQSSGRGQVGNTWDSEPYKNVTMSVYRDVSLPVEDFFYINMSVSLSILRALKKLKIPNVKIKWPNDIMVKDDKICGILAENTSRGKNLDKWIVGIGLNVNQTKFPNLSHVTSLKKITQTDYDTKSIVGHLLREMQAQDLEINTSSKPAIHKLYEKSLYNLGKIRVYKDNKDREVLFNGIVKGVDSLGRLKLETEETMLKYYNPREISLLHTRLG